MQISSASQSSVSSTADSQITGTSQNELGKDSFLKLLITQLRYQDPLSPMDNQEFIAQMAQFSSLEQLQNLNEKADTAALLSQALYSASATGMIGRHVRAVGDSVQLGETGTVELGYFLPQDAESVTLTLTDSSGNVVRTLVSDETTAGAHRITWPGTNLNGDRLPAGTYTFSVSAKDADGVDVGATAVVTGVVEGVTYQNGSAYLQVDGRTVSLSEVLEVYQ